MNKKSELFCKKKAYLFFTDLDGSFLPVNARQILNFVNSIFEICNGENIEFKIIPVTARPSEYVKSLSEILNNSFEDLGIKNVIDYAIVENGASLLNLRKGNNIEFLGSYKSYIDRNEIFDKFRKNPIGNLFEEKSLGRVHSCLFKLKSIYSKSLSKVDIKIKLEELSKSLKEELSGRVKTNIIGDYVEVTPKHLYKDVGINYLLSEYQKKFNIVGISYSGDSENDIEAVKLFTKLAEIPGQKVNVFLPSNAKPCLESLEIEGWKSKLRKDYDRNSCINKANKPFLEGINELFKNSYNSKKMLGKGIERFKTSDDLDLFLEKKKKISTEMEFL